jgi:predicted nucleic acid-binding protein
LGGEFLEVNIVDGRRITISEITEMEIQCLPNLNNAERKLLKEFINDCIIIRLNDEIKELAIKIRLTTRLKLMDAIIAATAQWSDLILVTSDAKFESLNSSKLMLLPSKNKNKLLKIFDPFSVFRSTVLRLKK